MNPLTTNARENWAGERARRTWIEIGMEQSKIQSVSWWKGKSKRDISGQNAYVWLLILLPCPRVHPSFFQACPLHWCDQRNK